MNGRARAVVAAVAILVLVAAATWWWTRSRSGASISRDNTPPVADTVPQLALHLKVLSAGPDDDTVVVIRPFDAGLAQKAALEAAERASGREWKSRARSRYLNVARANPPNNWAALVRLTSTIDQTSTSLTMRAVPTQEPDVAMFVLRAPAGARITASLPYLGQTVSSNTVTTRRLSNATDIVVAQGRMAEALGQPDALHAAAATLLSRDPNSVWGDYFRGAALERGGDTAGARAAYERALSHVVRGYEPPLGLTLRIERLQ